MIDSGTAARPTKAWQAATAASLAFRTRTLGPFGRWVLGLGVLVFTMHVPWISTIASMAVSVVVLAHFGMSGFTASRAFWRRIGALIAFCILYHAVCVGYGFVTGWDALKQTVYFVGLYTGGYVLSEFDGPTPPPGRTLVTLAIPAVGLVAFAAVTTFATVARSGTTQLAERAVTSLWDAAETFNAPGIGAAAGAGLCLAPAVLFSRSSGFAPKWLGNVARVAFGVLAVAGALTNLALQNRSPVVALAAAAVFATLIFAKSRHLSRSARLARVVAAAGLVVGMLLLFGSDAAHQWALYDRFMVERLESDRYEAWIAILQNLWATAFGGRTIDIGLLYAHNLWLDVVYDAGIAPALVLLAFHASHVLPALRGLGNLRIGTRTAILGILVSFLVACMVEPVLAFSPIYFAASGFILGALLRIAEGSAGPSPSAVVRRASP